jgi:hypothetical protein
MSTPQPRKKVMAACPVHHLKSDLLKTSEVSPTKKLKNVILYLKIICKLYLFPIIFAYLFYIIIIF